VIRNRSDGRVVSLKVKIGALSHVPLDVRVAPIFIEVWHPATRCPRRLQKSHHEFISPDASTRWFRKALEN